MGCDIHIHIEVQINGDWHHYNHPKVLRDYSLFSKMAGIRGEEDPISEPKGLPEDISFTTRFDAEHWGIDGHSHSYLGQNEIKQLREWMENQDQYKEKFFPLEQMFGFLFGNSLNGISEYPNEYPPGVEDARIVFWFDN